MRSIKLFLLIVFHLIHYENGACQFSGEFCRTDLGNVGVCLHIEECRSAQELLKRRGRPTICSFVGIFPIVCCEHTQNVITTKSDTYGLIANQKCEEYKISSVPTTTTTTTTTTTANPLIKYPVNAVTFAIGGRNAFPLEFPHMAILGQGSDDDIHWTCGGSLISEKFVLTAAHCIDTRYGRVQRVNLGVHQLSFLREEYLQSFVVKEVFIHPDYSSTQDYHDIALIELDRDADIRSGVRPACLHTEKDIPTDSFTATGWGATELYGRNSDILQSVDLKFVPYKNCSESYKRQKKLSRGLDDESQLCADGGGERMDTCQGDSGGPLQMKDPNPDEKFFTIVGITSFGIKCAIVPAVYTRVSHYIPWIESIVWPN